MGGELIGLFFSSMFGLGGVLLAGAAVAVAVASARHSKGEREERWRRLADACGITIPTGQSSRLRPAFTGFRGALTIRMQRFKRGKTQLGTRVIVEGLPPAIRVYKEGLGTGIERTFGAREHTLGDPAFDAVLFVQGEEPLVRAVLDVFTRQALLDVFTGYVRNGQPRAVNASATLEDGRLMVELDDAFGQPEEPQADLLSLIVLTCEKLLHPGDVPGRLAEIVYADPLATVRAFALTVLARDFPDHDATRQGLTIALGDLHPEVRLQAGLWGGEAGLPAIRSIAESVDVTDGCSARAVAGLAGHLDLERARDIFEGSVRAGRMETAQAALRSLGRGGEHEVGVVAPWLADRRTPLAVCAAQALGDSPAAAAAEVALIGALEDSRAEVVDAAAHALGRVGSARAVLSLRAVEARTTWGAHRAARQAVAQIQSRLTGATPGQLALAGDAAGQVALAEDAHGRVSFPRPPDAR